MNISDLFEESPNGYVITGEAPDNVEDGIEHYLDQLERFTKKHYPMEYGVINYALARMLFADPLKGEERAKRVENSLFYFKEALDIFNLRDYPMMYALISIYMGRLFRERAGLISHRSFLADRSTPSDCLQHGIDQTAEALSLYSANRAFKVENALACLELGYLIVCQLDLAEHAEDTNLREQGLNYLERCLSLIADLTSLTYREGSGNVVRWMPSDPASYPLHIKLLLEGYTIAHLEGTARYLLGRVCEITHREEAFAYYSQSVRPKLLSKQCALWADAHHRMALMIVKFPDLVGSESNIHLESALSHLALALRCGSISNTLKMDLYFHTAQVTISQLQLVIDSVPPGASVTKHIAAEGGLELIPQIETALREALKRVTPANTQSSNDAYVYYYSSLKLAEYRMLGAACNNELTPMEREEQLAESVSFMINACQGRSLADNMDLHYVSMLQFSQMLTAVKRSHASAKAYSKTLLVLTVMIDREVFNFNSNFNYKLSEDLHKHTSSAMQASSKEVEWVKLHLGPTVLHERVVAGYAVWSVEDLPMSRTGERSFTKVEGGPSVHVSPPKGVPPLQLGKVNVKKVYVSGEDVKEDEGKEEEQAFPPPEGPVPLYALGHNPVPVSNSSPALQSPRPLNSPYNNRLRSRVPPLSRMKEVERSNRTAYGGGVIAAGKVANHHLMPAAHGSTPTKTKKPDREEKAEEVSVLGSMEGSVTGGGGKKVRYQDDQPIPEADRGQESSDESSTSSKEEDVTRPRSKSIKHQPPPPGSAPPKKTMLRWLFQSKPKTHPSDTGSATASAGKKKFSLFPFGQKKKAPPKGAKKGKAAAPVPDVLEEVGLWASKQAFYMFMILSRNARLELIVRSKRLNLMQSERVLAVLYRKPKYLNTLYAMQSRLLSVVKDLVIISNLKELSALSAEDVSKLFKSHAQVVARLDDLEHFLSFKLTKIDFFIPLVAAAPALSRDMQMFDADLFNTDKLVANMTMERYYGMLKESKKHGGGPPAAAPAKLPYQPKHTHTYDSVSSFATGSSQYTTDKPLLNADEAQQAEEEKEEIFAGKMTYAMSAAIDGCGYLLNGQQGAKDMLLSSLALDECLMIWHLPALPGQPVVVSLAWRENSASLHAHYSSKMAYDARLDEEAEAAQNKKQAKAAKATDKAAQAAGRKGIVIEMAQSDLDASHTLQHIQRFLDALHAPNPPQRTAGTSDALKALSCALSISELLLLIPSSVKSLVICCNSLMRMVPWHLLLIERPEESSEGPARHAPLGQPAAEPGQVVVCHLMEAYSVRLGPSLALFELTSTMGHKLRQSVGLHRMVAVDGDDRSPAAVHSKISKGGVRGADLEVACAMTAWSADPDDSHLLSDSAASPRQLETAYFGEDRVDLYRKFKRQLGALRGTVENDDPVEAMIRNAMFGGQNGDSDADEEDEEAILAELKEISVEHRTNVLALTACRVLHLAAHKVPLDGTLTVSEDKLEAAIILPKDEEHGFIQGISGSQAEDLRRTTVTSEELARKIYVRNCALTVLSRFGLADDVKTVQSLSIDSNWEFVEALHAVGACSVLVPMWDGEGKGLSTLAHLLFILRFYSILPSRSRDRLSVVEATRRAQLWLRDVSADDAIAFVAKAPIPQKARETIIAEMEAYVTASLPRAGRKNSRAGAGDKSARSARSSVSGQQEEAPSAAGTEADAEADAGNRQGGRQKFFTHFLSWGAFIVSGYGGGVHHPDLTEEAEAEGDGLGDGLWGDEELNNIAFEASVLRMEGKIKEALELEKHIRQLRVKAVKARYEAMKASGWKAGRTLMDGLDYIDKAFLDQDSDEVSDVSADSDEEGNGSENGDWKGKKGKKNKKGMKAGEGESGKSTQSNPDADEEANAAISAKYQGFRPLDLDSRNQNVVYDEWRSKVGGLGDVKAPTIRKKNKVTRNKPPQAKLTPKKPDNYEYGLLNAMKPVAVAEDEYNSGNSSDEDGKKKKRKKKEENVSVWKEVFGGVRSYGEIAKKISEQAPELPLIERPAVSKEDCVIM